MVVVGIGTDVVALARFERLLARGGRRFLDRWFTLTEVTDCLRTDRPAHLAAVRFAAKEATVKSLRLPPGGPQRWREIEVSSDPEGRLQVQVRGSIEDSARSAGITSFHLSTSRDTRYAMAVVLATAS